MWALLPIKRGEYAKERLAGALSATERRALCRVMLEDLLAVLCNHPLLDGVAVVSDDPDVQMLAKRWSAVVLEESSLQVCGLNAVVQAAIREMGNSGISDAMVVHGDLPLLNASEVTQLVATHAALGTSAITLAPDRRGTGTNCILYSQSAGFRFNYGTDSFRKHCDQLLAAGTPWAIARHAGTACDIDYPDDLRYFLDSATGDDTSRTLRYLMRSGIAHRLRAATGISLADHGNKFKKDGNEFKEIGGSMFRVNERALR
jgi:2-phospho-L-lactate guanylyltransferase